jgi:hypothetical protein
VSIGKTTESNQTYWVIYTKTIFIAWINCKKYSINDRKIAKNNLAIIMVEKRLMYGHSLRFWYNI